MEEKKVAYNLPYTTLKQEHWYLIESHRCQMGKIAISRLEKQHIIKDRKMKINSDRSAFDCQIAKGESQTMELKKIKVTNKSTIVC